MNSLRGPDGPLFHGSASFVAFFRNLLEERTVTVEERRFERRVIAVSEATGLKAEGSGGEYAALKGCSSTVLCVFPRLPTLGYQHATCLMTHQGRRSMVSGK
jgi:hypothetical protein